MKRSRAVAFLAAEDDIATAPTEISTPARVPVLASLKAGWVFFFTRFKQIAARLWLAAVVLAVIEFYARAPGAGPDVVLALVYIFLYLFAFASLYVLALGAPQQRPVIAGFAIGPDELRFFLTTLIYLVIAGVLIGGAYRVGYQLAQWVSISGDVAKLANPTSLDDVRWFQDMPRVQQIVLTAPLGFAAVILLWFSTRYVFVPLHVVAVRKLAIFDALALTKHNTWRLLLLMVLLGLILAGVGFALTSAISTIELALIDSARNVMHGGTFAGGHHSLLKTDALRAQPQWIAPATLTFINLMAVSVIVGTLSHAYQKVAQR
ncbi:MAG: hypothetical protein WAW96_08160 [Alphaproteobacteria bacterium]